MSANVKTKESANDADVALVPAAEDTPPAPSNAPIGRQFAGQQHYAITSPEAEAARVALQKQYDDPEAVPLNVYFAVKQITNPVMQASMRAFTTVTRATIAAWDDLFRKH